MPVLLHRSTDLPTPHSYVWWMVVTAPEPDLDHERRFPGQALALEEAFDHIRDDWWALGRLLAETPGGRIAHAPTCAPYNSDLGLMMAWGRLVGQIATRPENVLILCDDPWVFRHLADLDGVSAGRPPKLWRREFIGGLRGMISRGRVAVRAALAALRTRSTRANHAIGDAVLVVYGHPASSTDGKDAYFGTLMRDILALKRVLHTDCHSVRAMELSADNRTASLHAWGHPLFALTTMFSRWRPKAGYPYPWLVRRAAHLEAAGGSGAANAWQAHCQRRWLAAIRPRSICWPWENHPWERSLVLHARELRVTTAGYQHVVVGRHMYNQSSAPNPGGITELPDILLCNGPGYLSQLRDWGVPVERLRIAGSLRISPIQRLTYDPAAPFFVALSHDPAISAQMVDALSKLSKGIRFLVKAHPMFPFQLIQSETLRRTEVPLPEQQELAGVIFSTGTVGLESLLGGLPTFRFLPHGLVALHTLPPGVEAIDVDADTLDNALVHPTLPRPISWHHVLSPPDLDTWLKALMI